MVNSPKRIFIARVHGEYITQIGDDRVLKSYTAQFRLPNADAPLGIIKGKLLTPFLKKLDVNAVAPYSWYLDEIKPENGAFDPDELPVLFQTIPQLKEYCKRHKLPVPVEEYGDLETARQHVLIAKDSPETFQKLYEHYQHTMVADRELAELNSGFEGIGSAAGEVEVDPGTGSVAPRSIPRALPKPAATFAKRAAPIAEDADDVLS